MCSLEAVAAPNVSMPTSVEINARAGSAPYTDLSQADFGVLSCELIADPSGEVFVSGLIKQGA